MEKLKIKKINTVLIVIIVILFLFVVGLGYYTYFIRNKNNTKTNENNTVKEEKNNVVKEDKLSKDEITEIIYKFPYEKLLENKSKTVSDLTDKEKFLIGVYSLSSVDFKKIEIKDLCNPADINIEKYTLAYNSKTKTKVSNQLTLYSICIGQKDGLSSENLLKLDTKLWNKMIGNITGEDIYYSINLEKLYNKIKLKTGLDFSYNESFSDYINFNPTTNIHFYSEIVDDNNDLIWVYDKNVNKLYLKTVLNNINSTQYSIIAAGKKDNDNYSITVYSGYFNLALENAVTKYYLSKTFNSKEAIGEALTTNITNKQKADLVYKYKESLNKYNITFKKVEDNYQFVSIEYIEQK